MHDTCNRFVTDKRSVIQSGKCLALLEPKTWSQTLLILVTDLLSGKNLLNGSGITLLSDKKYRIQISKVVNDLLEWHT